MKPPQRLNPNGIVDAFEDYEIVNEPTLYPPRKLVRQVTFSLQNTTV